MRSVEWKQLIGKILHRSICLWLVMNKSSVFSAQKSTYFQILYCVLVRYTRTSNQTLHGNKDWSRSKVYRNTEPWTELMVSQWNSSGISSQDLIRCTSVKKFKSYCWDKMKHQRIFTGRIIFMSMFNEISWRSKDNEKESRMLSSFLYMQKDLE